jgi:hypothetical protein
MRHANAPRDTERGLDAARTRRSVSGAGACISERLIVLGALGLLFANTALPHSAHP